ESLRSWIDGERATTAGRDGEIHAGNVKKDVAHSFDFDTRSSRVQPSGNGDGLAAVVRRACGQHDREGVAAIGRERNFDVGATDRSNVGTVDAPSHSLRGATSPAYPPF